jgi:hypothetical protein
MTRDTRSRSSWSIALCALVAAGALPVMSDEEPRGNGVWKFKAPSTPIRGEFNNEDLVGLAAGAHLGTDCSITWTAADGKIYALPPRRHCSSLKTRLRATSARRVNSSSVSKPRGISHCRNGAH